MDYIDKKSEKQKQPEYQPVQCPTAIEITNKDGSKTLVDFLGDLGC